MDYSSPPSRKAPHPNSHYSNDDKYYAAVDIPHSRSAMNAGRLVPDGHDQSQMRAIDGDLDMEPAPSRIHMAPGLGKSHYDPSVDSEYTNRGTGAVNLDGEKPKTMGDLADERKHNSGVVGKGTYEGGKMPSIVDLRQNKGNSISGNQKGGYQYISGPKSYNGQYFGQFY
ncbi:hypothetical protein L2E82_34615 [Cichorium intybus]|uniref:Uncharacterized protein n=1 Tax=Cichorium intybus TaxID=13427 RepID=A0ACB9BMH4_CICIN|nr:hypothetical protein L2E82_34615 [Cichorium intybus]